MIRIILAVSLGAILGALLRYYIGILFAFKLGTNFPYGTFFVNITGSLIMGFIVTLSSEKIVNIPADILILITGGFLGSYTTFSSYELDSFKLLNNGQNLLFMCYWLGSSIFGLLGIKLGNILAKFLI